MKSSSFFFFLVFVLAITSCAPAPKPAPKGDLVATSIAATIAAMPTNTPYPTLTPSITPTKAPPTEFPTLTLPPTIRPLSSLTLAPTETPLASPTTDGGSELGKGQGDDNYGCKVIGQRPDDWTNVRPGQTITVVWRISNIGKKSWTQEEVILKYLDGSKIAVNGLKQPLLSSVKTGGVANISLVLKAPEKKPSDKPANYLETVWGLAKGDKVFCQFAFGLTVK